jgi:hypothetical protein
MAVESGQALFAGLGSGPSTGGQPGSFSHVVTGQRTEFVATIDARLIRLGG